MAISVDEGLTTLKVTGTTDASAKVTDKWINIKSVYWFNPTTAGHLLTIVDKNSGPIMELRAESDNASQFYELGCAYSGIYITDMDSGTLYIYR